jgi:hypothetical protein
MKLVKNILVALTGILLTVDIYRSLTLDKFEKLDYLLMPTYSILILIFSVMEIVMKRRQDIRGKHNIVSRNNIKAS